MAVLFRIAKIGGIHKGMKVFYDEELGVENLVVMYSTKGNLSFLDGVTNGLFDLL
ncbi:hypothetical protein [Lysinibacillus sphaericus]|uniref:hypothetical protein n=1 Tax=Lysinibacillus sphaericus TaxID=1421 RepID=UPI003F7AF6EC